MLIFFSRFSLKRLWKKFSKTPTSLMINNPTFPEIELLEQKQLVFLQILKEYRTPFLDYIAKVFNFFDTPPFFILLIPFIWIFYKRYWGISCLYLFLLSSSINSLLKNFFQIPRPFYFDPNLNLVEIGDSFAFPSGASTTAVILGVLLIWVYPKSIWAWILGVNFFIWHSFSRLYLGVHYPLDLLGGWIVGTFLVLLFIYLFPKLASIGKRHLISITVFQFILIVILFAFYPDKELMRSLSTSLGICVGLIFAEKRSYFINTWQQKSMKYIFCIIGIFLGGFLLSKPIFSLTKYCLPYMFMGLWIVYFQEKILKKLDTKKRKICKKSHN